MLFRYKIFNILVGLFGGSDLGKILRMNCTVNKTHDESPWYSLLCIHRHNSPYIGQYFKVTVAHT